MANRNAAVGSGRNEGGIDPRNGGAKKTQGAADAHPGMAHRVAPDLLAKGLSRTESARLLGADQVGEVHGGGQTNTAPLKEAQKGQPLKPHPSMISQRQREASMDNGGKIIGEAIFSGSTRLPDQVSEQTDSGTQIRQPDCKV